MLESYVELLARKCEMHSMREKEAQVTHTSLAPIRLNAKSPFKSHHERCPAEVSYIAALMLRLE